MPSATTSHDLLGGKLHVYRRGESPQWQCSTYLNGKNHRVSTKTDSLAKAKKIAQDWYLTLHGKLARGDLKNEKTFKDAAKVFEREYEIITEGQRSARYVKTQSDRLRIHLIPYFGSMPLSGIRPGTIQEYRVHRTTSGVHWKTGKPLGRPSRSTLHQEIVALRQVLKTAVRHGWLDHVPDLSAPYKTSGKVSHRAWFSPEEYRQFYTASRKRAAKLKGTQWEWSGAQFHDYVLFMANTGLRPDEAARVQFRDVAVVEEGGETILEIQVRGKRGVGYCKSTRGAVLPFERLKKRVLPTTKKAPTATDLLFPKTVRKLFETVLKEEGLKVDREGQQRTAYSLRHTYICMRLMEGADIYQVAKNCRTSVEMIENFYAAHIRTSLNAAAINVRRARPAEAEPPSR